METSFATAAAAAADVDAAPAVATEGSEATSSKGRVAEDDEMGLVVGGGAAHLEKEEEKEESSVRGAEAAGGIGVEGAEEAEKAQNAPAAEARRVREDAVALAGILEEIASSDSAPEEVALAGGWGPEHSNAAAFYAKEVALLCGAGAGAGGEAQVAPGVAGSHLRVRYLDVLSSLVRYNLKVCVHVKSYSYDRMYVPDSIKLFVLLFCVMSQVPGIIYVCIKLFYLTYLERQQQCQ